MLLLISILSITLSSFLLFSIQPLAAKDLLPVFGGGPSVWNICLVFFQGMLLFGYLNIYLITRFFSRFFQFIFLFFLAACSLYALPILWNEITPHALNYPALNVMKLLLTKLTLPLLMLSMTAPLLQYWFSQSNHPKAKNPYFLYSASNVGSLIALLGFPFLLEPFYGLQALSKLWSILYISFLGLLIITFLKNSKIVNLRMVTKEEKIHYSTRAHWLLLSFAPTSLLMAVTQHITMDIVATPLLWILPLTLYLLSFIIAFADKPLINQNWMIKNQIYFLLFPLISLGQLSIGLPVWALLVFHLLGFFVLTMVCNGELIKARPTKEYLTEYYLWIALGGFLGGVFNAILAPHLFSGIYEYYIAFCLCVLLKPNSEAVNLKFNLLLPFLVIIILSMNYYFSPWYMQFWFYKWIDLVAWLSVITMIVIIKQRTFLLILNLAIVFIFSQSFLGFSEHKLIWQSRNFFGLTRIYQNDNLNLHILMSGSTLHGLQILNGSNDFNRRTAYYDPLQSVANFLIKNAMPIKVGIAGLGAGNLSCQFRDRDLITYFEIDPDVVRIAKNPKFFSYLKNCPPKGGVVIGDARIGIHAAASHYFDAIVIDVYSSDAIPTHLFTLNAVQLYLEKLAPEGVLIFNVSSRYVNFKPILLAISDKLHLHALHLQSKTFRNLQMPSEWILLTYNTKLSAELKMMSNWQDLQSTKKILWTDDFSNVLSVLKMQIKV